MPLGFSLPQVAREYTEAISILVNRFAMRVTRFAMLRISPAGFAIPLAMNALSAADFISLLAALNDSCWEAGCGIASSRRSLGK